MVTKYAYDTKSFIIYGNTPQLQMPITTRTVAKGIPPRLRGPKGKAHKKKKLTKKHTPRKRSADSESEGDEEENISGDSHAAHKKEKCRHIKKGKRHRIEPLDSNSEDLEIVDKDTKEKCHHIKKGKRRRIEALDSNSEDLEIVDKDESESPAEEVDMHEDEVGPSELEVSHHHQLKFWRLTI